MHYQNHCLIFLALISSACAVFYTKSTDNDYPRIGRRSFYTSGSETHYPRIGRRDATTSQIQLPGLEFADFSTLHKRGVFTQSAHGSYPRVGRGSEEAASGEDYVSERRNKLWERIAGIQDELEEEGVSKEGNSRHGGRIGLNSPLDVLFIKFDIDSDGKLSKEEFLSGLSKYRQHRSGC